MRLKTKFIRRMTLPPTPRWASINLWRIWIWCIDLLRCFLDKDGTLKMLYQRRFLGRMDERTTCVWDKFWRSSLTSTSRNLSGRKGNWKFQRYAWHMSRIIIIIIISFIGFIGFIGIGIHHCPNWQVFTIRTTPNVGPRVLDYHLEKDYWITPVDLHFWQGFWAICGSFQTLHVRRIVTYRFVYFAACGYLKGFDQWSRGDITSFSSARTSTMHTDAPTFLNDWQQWRLLPPFILPVE